MSDIAATLEAVDSRIKITNERIGSKLCRVGTVLQRLTSVVKRQPLSLEDFGDELEELQDRFGEKKLVIVVSGATSAGKSTLINAILRLDLLFTAPEHCTPSSVSIETALEADRPFFTERKRAKGCKEHDISELRDFSDAKSQTASCHPLFVYLPPKNDAESVLRIENLRLVDSPGLYEAVDDSCVDLEGDAFAFVVDFDVGVKWKELQKKLRDRSEKAVFFVFNRCDTVELFDRNRFELGKKEKLAKAVKFLTENKIFKSEAAASKSVFFLSARDAMMKRKYDNTLRELKAAVVRSCRAHENPKLFVCGGQEVGKSSLCNGLIDLQLLPSGETSCFVRLQTPEAAESPQSLQDLRSGLEARLQEATSDVIRVSVGESLLQSTSLLRQGITVVDSPPVGDIRNEDLQTEEKQEAAMNAAVIAVVVSAASHQRKMKRCVEKCLELFGQQRNGGSPPGLLLVVTKMNEVRAKEGEERARSVEREIRDLWRSAAQSELVYFLEKEALMEKYGAAFDDFEQHLLEAGHERFEELKLKKIESSADTLREKIDTKVRMTIADLEKIVDTFVAALEALEAKKMKPSDEAKVIKDTRVDRFLRGVSLPHNTAAMEMLFTQFLPFLRDDLARFLHLLVDTVLESLKRVDSRCKANAQQLLESEISTHCNCLDLKNGECQQRLRELRAAVPPAKSEQEQTEARLRGLREQRNGRASHLAELGRQKDRRNAEKANAQRTSRERAGEIATLAERSQQNQALVRDLENQSTELKRVIASYSTDCAQADAAADEARAEADAAGVRAARAEAEVQALTRTIDNADNAVGWIFNPIGNAINLPRERNRRSGANREKDEHRRRETAARGKQSEQRRKAEELRKARSAKELERTAIEQRISVSKTLIDDANAKKVAEERRKKEAETGAQEADRELSRLNSQLQVVDRELKELDAAVGNAERTLRDQKDRYEAMTLALPVALRTKLDDISELVTRATVAQIQKAFQGFVNSEIAELKREKRELDEALQVFSEQ